MRAICLPTYWPICFAAGARPGTGLPPLRTEAVSPMTNTSAFPGNCRNSLTGTRPARSPSMPSHSAAGDAFTPAAHSTQADSIRSPQRNSLIVATGYCQAGQHLDPDITQDPLCVVRQVGRKARQDARSGLSQYDPGRLRIDFPEIANQHTVCDLRDRACQLNAGGTRADHDECHEFPDLGFRGGLLGALKAVRIFARIRVASSIVFKPGAYSAHSGRLKYELYAPVAITR